MTKTIQLWDGDRMGDKLTILVDSNVWIDSYVATHSRHRESLAFVNDALACGSNLLYGASKLETIFYVLQSEAKRIIRSQTGALSEADAGFALQYAWGCIDNLCDIATAVGTDQGDLWLARKYRVYHPDLENNVLLAAAARSQADYLVTWDHRLLRDATAVVRAVTPTTMSVVINQGE